MAKRLTKRDSMVFYRSFYEAIKELEPAQQGVLYNAIFSYSLDFTEPKLEGICKTIWTLIKPQLDANIKRYENGLRPKQKQNRSKTEAKTKQDISKSEANVNDNVNDNDNYNEKVNVNANEKPPQKAQVLEFFQLRSQSSIEANQFFDYYEAADWQDKFGKYVNWQQKAISWISRVDKKKQEVQYNDPYKKQQLKY